MSTQKYHTAIATTRLGEVDEIKVPTKNAEADEVLIKVDSASVIAFDTYMSDIGYRVEEYPTVLGFNTAGTVVQLGKDIANTGDLAIGDRVAAWSLRGSPSRGLQQYSVHPRSAVSKIPDHISFEAAATIPDNFITAFYILFHDLELPVPEKFPATTPPPLADTPILVYGAAATTGQYTIQLLHAAGYRNIFATASAKHHEFLRSLGATHLFDYTNPDFPNEISKVIGGEGKVPLAIDIIATEATLAQVAKVISPTGTVAVLLPVKLGAEALLVDHKDKFVLHAEGRFLPGIKALAIKAFTYLESKDEFLKNNLMQKILPSLLESGVIKPVPYRVLDEGGFKKSVEVGMDLLRQNKVRGEKLIVKIPA